MVQWPGLLLGYRVNLSHNVISARRRGPSEPEGRGAAWTDAPKGRGAAWTEERGARDERRVTREGSALSAPEAHSKQSTSDERRATREGSALSAPEAHKSRAI